MSQVQLIYGDCLEVMPTLPVNSVQMVFADLPYGSTDNKWDKQIPLDAFWAQTLAVLQHGAAFCFTASQPYSSRIVCSNPKMFRYDIVWDKRTPVGHLNANRQPLRRHEHLLIFCAKAAPYAPQMIPGVPYKKGPRARSENYGTASLEKVASCRAFAGPRYPTSIFATPSARGLHPTQKPVALLEWLIKTYTNEGDTVLDPVMGSGTTGVACLRTRRNFIGIEKDATYFDVACKRIAAEQPRLDLPVTA